MLGFAPLYRPYELIVLPIRFAVCAIQIQVVVFFSAFFAQRLLGDEQLVYFDRRCVSCGVPFELSLGVALLWSCLPALRARLLALLAEWLCSFAPPFAASIAQALIPSAHSSRFSVFLCLSVPMRSYTFIAFFALFLWQCCLLPPLRTYPAAAACLRRTSLVSVSLRFAPAWAFWLLSYMAGCPWVVAVRT